MVWRPSGKTVAITNRSDYNSPCKICRLHDGPLIAVWRNGSVHCCDNSGRLMFSRSYDNGKTWESEQVLGGITGLDDHMPTVAEFLIDGVWTILVNWWSIDAGTGPWGTESHLYVLKSTDGGDSWRSPIQVSAGVRSSSGHPIIRLSNGKLALIGEYNGGGAGQIYFYESSDGGNTWAEYFVGSEANLMEACLIETKTNREFVGGMYLIARKNIWDSKQYLRKATSMDYGHTWSGFAPTALSHSDPEPAEIIRLASGRIVIGWCPRASNYDGELRLLEAESENTDIVWKDISESVIVWKSTSYTRGNFAYVGLFEAEADPIIGVSYYCGQGNITNLYLTWVTLEIPPEELRSQ